MKKCLIQQEYAEYINFCTHREKQRKREECSPNPIETRTLVIYEDGSYCETHRKKNNAQ